MPRPGGHTPGWNRPKARAPAGGPLWGPSPFSFSQGRSSGAGLREEPVLFSVTSQTHHILSRGQDIFAGKGGQRRDERKSLKKKDTAPGSNS